MAVAITQAVNAGSSVGTTSFLKQLSTNYTNLIFGTEKCDLFTSELQKIVWGTKNEAGEIIGRQGLKDFGKNFKTTWGKTINTAGTAGKSFWGATAESLKTIPADFKIAREAVKVAGKGSKVLGPLGKTLGKRMPLIGNILMVAMEIPNLVKAFTDKKHGGGLTTGVAETGKAAVKIGAFAAGAVIGQALIPIPFVGGMIGGIVAGFIAEKVVGKSFSEKADEAIAKEAEETQTMANAATTETVASAETQTTAKQSSPAAPVAATTASAYPTNNANQFLYNPRFASAQSNPFANQDFMNKDFMAMCSGLEG